jgi:hypothetical protein
MRAIGIGHHGKGLIVFDQLIDKHFCILVMDIVVSCAVDKEQISFQLMRSGST